MKEYHRHKVKKKPGIKHVYSDCIYVIFKYLLWDKSQNSIWSDFYEKSKWAKLI